MSIQIPLSNRSGLFALVSDEDEGLVSPYRWYLSNNGYVVARVKQDTKRLLLYQHRLILQAQTGQICDHTSGDKLDNRRANLRFVTPQQNVRNRRVPRNSRTGLIGVTPYRDQYQARIRVNRKQVYLGCYESAEIAALMRDAYARRIDPKHFALNYPDRPTQPEINALLNQILSGTKPPRPKKPKPASLGKSAYRGVYSERGRWRVKISVKGKDVHIGYFDEEHEAARAYDRVARQYHGSEARLNFPDLARERF